MTWRSLPSSVGDPPQTVAEPLQTTERNANNSLVLDQLPRLTLDTLPPDELAKILRFLEVRDVHNLQVVSKSLHQACQDERVWHSLCDAMWGQCTDVRLWLPERGQTVPPARGYSRPPSSYQELFHLLHLVGDLAGLWRVIGEGPIGALVSFKWTPDGIVGHEVQYHMYNDPEPEFHSYQRVSPRRGLTVAVDWDDTDGTTVTLRVLGPPPGGEPRLRRSSSADAAASVGFSGTPQTPASLLGASPQGSFEHAYLEFMSSSVQKSSKLRRRSSRKGIGPALYHLRRVVTPLPSNRHPLAGIYLGEYGPAGLQFLTIRYDFSGRAARIVAEKVTGDTVVAAGQQVWWALAGAMHTPWAPDEVDLLNELERRIQEEEEEQETQSNTLPGSLAALFLAEGGGGGGGSDDSDEVLGNMDGVPSFSLNEAAGMAARHAHAREVVGLHMGAGQIDGREGSWSEGRLWVHGDESLTFWWLEGPGPGGSQRRVTMRRVDSQLCHKL